MAKTTAYLRVSTDPQDVKNQRLDTLMLAKGVGLGGASA